MLSSDAFDVEDLISDPDPLWLWDGISGRIYWANDAGLKFWAVEHLSVLQAMQFDHSMPALRRLSKLAVSDFSDEGLEEQLLFWGARGIFKTRCHCLKIAVEGYGDLLLLRLISVAGGVSDLTEPVQSEPVLPDKSRSERKSSDLNLLDAASLPAASPSASRPASSDVGDVAATLREIARQVRAEAKGGGAPPTDGAAKPSDIGRRDRQSDVRKFNEVDRFGQSREREDKNSDVSKDADVNDISNINEVDFIAKVSHEVRTPLNSILGFSELMMQERFGAVENKKYAEYIGDIHESAKLALSLINDMLDLSRMNAGRFDVGAEPVELNGVARSMLSLMRPQAENNGVGLEIELASFDLTINAGLRSIKQILLNLLTNAIKFTPRGGRVTLMTGLVRPGTAYVKISDSGFGMTAPDVELAMQPYARLETKSRPVEGADLVEGTGLGLPITKALVDANGGSFSIASEPGIGTEITLCFPIYS